MFKRQKPSIAEYFRDKNVFITGATGFLGKVLIEKLLRSCSSVGTVYVLVRSKKGKSHEERMKQILNEDILFSILKEKDPTAIHKVKPIAGDITQVKLGISEDDEKVLLSKVNIIFHVAASVRFDDPLRKAVFTNVRSTRDITRLAQKCRCIEAYVHVSTAYCNADRQLIEEKFYPAYIDWQEMIDLAESDKKEIEELAEKYIAPLPNTYTFTKRIAEQVVMDHCKDKIPAIIFRPSIVIHASREPIPSWVDNLNGPFSLSVTGLMGIMSSFLGNPESFLDTVLADNVVKGVLIATREKGYSGDRKNISIYNACSEVLWKMKWFSDYCDQVRMETMLEKCVWLCNISIDTCYYKYYIITVCHLITGMVVDKILNISNKGISLARIVRKIFSTQQALRFFMEHNFKFVTEEYDKLETHLLEGEKNDFLGHCFSPKTTEDVILESSKAVIGIKRFILKEEYPVPASVKKKYKRLALMRKTFDYGVIAIAFWILIRALFYLTGY